MSTFLTSQEIQDLISVDRSTVYRMAEDGRLPGVKVGRQWRFPADRVAAQLGLPTGMVQAATPTHQPASVDRLDGLLRPDDAQSIADLIGELFGIMAVITDLEGRPVTTVANPCGYYAAIADQPGAVAACLSQWRSFADEPNVAPRWVRTHLGVLCARTFVWVDLKPVGMIVVGGVTPPSWPPPQATIESIAAEIGVASDMLADRVGATWDLDVTEQRHVLRLLPQMGDLVSQLVTARRHLADCRESGVAVATHDVANGTRHHHDLHDLHHVPQGGDRS